MTDRRRARRPIPRRAIYGVALAAMVAALVVVLTPGRERLRAAGPANTGHEQLACTQCHTPAEGTPRQQIQANVRFALGLRTAGVAFLHEPVRNADCQACHQNEEDRHPVYRFNEPRFAEVRATLAPQNCVSCHVEHSGRRVTAEPTMCVSCHAEMEIEQDPAEPSHSALLALEAWGTCLSCHDFHGNHVRDTPFRIQDGATKAAIARYLAGGPSIYGEKIRFPAKTLREAQ